MAVVVGALPGPKIYVVSQCWSREAHKWHFKSSNKKSHTTRKPRNRALVKVPANILSIINLDICPYALNAGTTEPCLQFLSKYFPGSTLDHQPDEIPDTNILWKEYKLPIDITSPIKCWVYCHYFT